MNIATRLHPALRPATLTLSIALALTACADNNSVGKTATAAKADNAVSEIRIGHQKSGSLVYLKDQKFLEQALATPPEGHPNCASEPLPVGALRLLQPAHNRGANQGGQAAAAAGAGTKLPGT